MGNDQEFGELILLIGDFHIPDREPCIPQAFEELLNTDKIRHVLCTGNIGCNNLLEKLKQVAPNVHVVQGDMDIHITDQTNFPEYKVITICGFRIGLIHGHQIVPWGSTEALIAWQRKLDCDILVSGFTHQNTAEKVQGKVYINPGSATGSYKANAAVSTTLDNNKVEGSADYTGGYVPSFMLMAIQGLHVVLYVYELRDGTVHVAMSEFTKDIDVQN